MLAWRAWDCQEGVCRWYEWAYPLHAEGQVQSLTSSCVDSNQSGQYWDWWTGGMMNLGPVDWCIESSWLSSADINNFTPFCLKSTDSWSQVALDSGQIKRGSTLHSGNPSLGTGHELVNEKPVMIIPLQDKLPSMEDLWNIPSVCLD